MIGDQADIFARLRGLLPASWLPQGQTPVADALLQGPAWGISNAYAQQTYAALQERIKTATDAWLDIISGDFFGTTLPRLPNEPDGAFRARILANLFIKGPTLRGMNAVLKLITGRAPTIFEPSRPDDSGAWDSALYFDAAGGWGDPLPYQSFVTVYRPAGNAQDLGEWDTYRFSFDQNAYWSDAPVTDVTDASLIAAVESTRALGTVIWMRIADQPVIP